MEKEKKEEMKDERADDIVLTEGPVTVSTSMGDFVVVPWPFGIYAKVGHIVDNMFHDLEARGVGFELLFNRHAMEAYFFHVGIPLEEGKEVDPEIAELAAKDFDREYGKLMRVMAIVAPQAREIIHRSLEIEYEHIDGMQADEVMRLFMTILSKNEGVLKNVYGLFETTS